MSTKLYIVATPIGNLEDITLRAISILKTVDVVLCEEEKPARKLLKALDIPGKSLISINEHNEPEVVDQVLYSLLQQNQSAALISDCGTPVFSDPGATLIQRAVESGIQIVPVPGVSSLMATLSVLDVQLKNFVFGGFLSRDGATRIRELTRLKNLGMPVILMDTPYRLSALLTDAAKVFGKGRQATLACDMTTNREKIFRGTLGEILSAIQERKPEFILVVHEYQREQR